MSYKEKPQLKLFSYINEEFELQAIIDDYESVSIENNLYQAGQFLITINYNIPNALLFKRGMFIQFGNDPYNFGEIYNVSDAVSSEGKAGQKRTISGYDARYLFKRRIIKNLNSNDTWNMTAKGEICMRNLISDQAGETAEAKRRLPINNTIPTAENALGKEYTVSEAFTNLYDVLCTIATQSEIGWRIKFDGELTLEVFNGEDISDSVFFSTDFESLENGNFNDTSESFTNAVYVGGKGDGSQRDIYEGESAIEGSSPSSLDRFESWDNQSELTNESEYENEALSILSQYGQNLVVNGNGLAKCPYVFKEQYNIGDTIKIAFSGKSANVQILSVTEFWQKGNYQTTFSFGKPQNNLKDQLQLILKKIQIASNKAKTIDSVMWYTIPDTLVMDKSEVTFNTIGFTGNVDTGKTFKLYIDEENTGSKNYNIYVKNLAGSGKLTLATDRAGSSGLELPSGSYVAQVYVDTDGNVLQKAISTVNTVESGNMHSVTSNAVAKSLQGKLNNTLSDITSSEIDNLSGSEISVHRIRAYDIGWISNDGFIIHIPWSNKFARQIALDEQSNWLAIRFKANEQWSPWKILSGSDSDDAGKVNISASVSKYLGVDYVEVCRRNNLVYMHISGTYTGSPTYATQQLVGGLPTKYLPKFEQTFSVVAYAASGNFVYPSRIIVAENSVAIGETAMPNGAQIRMGFIYIGA